MNRQYKVIWSKVKHCYIVVSELVKRNGKSSSVKSKSGQKIGVTLAVLALCFGVTGSSLAADLTEDQQAVYDAVVAEFNYRFSDLESRTDALVRETANIPIFNESDRGISIGEGAVATEVSNIAIGYKANAGTEYSSHIAIGSLSEALGGQSIAIGDGAVANSGFTIAIGHNADVTSADGESSDSIGIGTNLVNRGMRTILIGGDNGSQSEPVTSNFAVGIGFHSLPGDTGVAIGEWSSSGLWGNSMGAGANARGDKSQAIGFQAYASHEGAVALGHKAFAMGDNAVAIGHQSYAVNKEEIVESYLSDEHIYPVDGVVSVGNTEYQLGDEYVGERHRRITNMAGGVDDYDAANIKQLKALKREVDADKIKYVSILSAIDENKANDGATGLNSVAIGPKAGATGDGTVAVGWNAQATGIGHSAALGASAKAAGQGSLAVGPGAEAYGKSGIAIGNAAISNTEDLDESSIAIGDRAEAKSDGSIGMGIMAGASGKRSIAMGHHAKATGDYSMSLGSYNNATAAESIAIGHNADAVANYSVAIGAKSVADRGYDTYGYAIDHAAFKDDTDLLTYLGKIDEYNAAVDVVIANQKDYKEKAAAAKADRNNDELRVAAEQANAKLVASQQALLKLTAAYKSYFGAVSVGTDFATRQIINVAAGTEDTDAVNVAQLKALNTKVDANKIEYVSINSTYEENKANDGATEVHSVAIGPQAGATSNSAIAIGRNAQASGSHSAAYGPDTKAMGQSSLAMGNYSVAELKNSTALGAFSNSIGTRSLAVGSHNVAVGHDSVAVGYGSLAFNGYIDKQAYDALSPEEQEKFVKPSGVEHYFLKETTNGNNIAGNYLNTAVGSYARAFKHGVALGGISSAAENGTAIGTSAKVTGKGAVSLGYNTKGNVENGVALGAHSVADREKGKIGYALGGDNSTIENVMESIGQKARYDELTAIIEPLKDDYSRLYSDYWNAPSGSAAETEAKQKLDSWIAEHPEYLPAAREQKRIISTWQSGNGAVSVGSAGATRQITNVASGSEDTDAVNVAQLKALNTKVDANKIEYVSINSSVEENKANDGATATDTVAIGPKASATYEGAVAIGRNVEAAGGVAIGQNSKSTSEHSVAIGLGSVAGDSLQADVAIGNVAKAAGYSVAIGNGASAYMDPETEGGSGLAVAIGSSAVVSGQGGVAVGQGSKAVFQSNAMGSMAKASARGAVAIGDTTEATGAGAVAIGNRAEADNVMGIAIGTYTKGLGYGTIGIGGSAEATGNWSLAMGQSSVASAKFSTALGHYSNVSSEKSVAVGPYASAQNGSYATAMGYSASTKAGSAVALGSYSAASGGASMALGYDSSANINTGVALGAFSVADRGSKVYGYNVDSVGFASDEDIAAYLGKAETYQAATEDFEAKLAVYNEKKAALADDPDNEQLKAEYEEASKAAEASFDARNAIVSAYRSGLGALSVGTASETRQITNVAAGSEDTDAVNVAQLRGLKSLVDSKTENLEDNSKGYFHANMKEATDPSWNNYGLMSDTGGAGGYYSVAAGIEAQVSKEAEKAVAIGYRTKTKQKGGIAIGYDTVSDGERAVAIGQDSVAKGVDATALGFRAEALNEQSLALGNQSKATGAWSIAIAQDTEASGHLSLAASYGAKTAGLQSVGIGVLAATSEAAENSVAIGTMAQALGENTTAIGPSSKVQGSRSVGLGQSATTESTALNGTAIGRNAYIGAIRNSGSIGVPSYKITQGDDTQPEAGKEHMNSTALGFAAKAFGFQTLSVGNAAESYDTNTIAIGVNAIAKDHYATALGKQAYVDGKNSMSIGHVATTVGEDSVSIGTLSTIQGLDGQTAVNKSATLGAYSRAAIDNSVALGDHSLAYISDDVATEAYLTDEAFAKENGVVSVGNAEYTIGDTTVEANRRRITNVAGGADAYDAVNVAQLQAVEAEGLNFKGDGDTVVHRDLGTELTISGGNSDSTTLTDGNIGVVADQDSGSLSVKLSKDINLDDGSVTFAETAKDADGNILVKGEDGKWYTDLTDAVYDADTKTYTKDGAALTAVTNPIIGTVKLTSDGLNNGNQRITNVAAGVDGTDAVNMSQLTALNTKVDANKIEYVSINSSEEGNKLNDGAIAKDSIAIGPNVKTSVEAGVAIGRNIDSKGGVAVGDEAYSSSKHSVAIGFGAIAGETDVIQADVAIGDGAKAKGYSVAIGNGANAFGGSDSSSDDVSLAVAIGSSARVSGQGGVALGDGTFAAFGSSAMGMNAKAKGENAVSIGHRSSATGNSTVSIGFEAKTDSVYGVAMGPGAKGLGFGSVGIGGEAEATANWSMAMGQKSAASAQLSMALGHYSKATSLRSVALGHYATTEVGTDATAVGYKAKTTAGGGASLGAYSVADRAGGVYGYTVDGVTFTNDAEIAAYLGKTVEYQAATEDFNAKLAVFNEKKAALADDPNNKQLKAEVNEAGAATQASFEARNAIVSAYHSGSGAVSVGNLGDTRQIINVAAGSQDTDAVNLAQLKAVNSKVDANKIEYVSINSTEAGNKANDGATGTNAIAIGPNAKATAYGSIGIGSGQKINQDDSQSDYKKVDSQFAIAIGHNSVIDDKSEVSVASGYQSEISNSVWATAYGPRAKVVNSQQGTAIGQSTLINNSAFGTALGTYAKVTNSDSGIAIGSKARVEGAPYGMAIGIDSSVTNQGGVALGYGTAVTEKSGVALGLGAIADRSAEVYGYSPDGTKFTDDASIAAYLGKTAEFEAANQEYAKKVEIFHEKAAAYQQNPKNPDAIKDYIDAANDVTAAFEKRTGIIAAYKPHYGAASVGGSGATRQIINVAAGTEDTDAVNLAQLKTVETIAKAHTELTLDGKSAEAGANGALGDYIGDNNLTMAVKDVNGQKVYDLKLKNEVVIGQPGKDGKDGTPGSIGLVGPQGPAGEDGQPGKNAYGEISVKNGVDGVDGKHGKDGITRIVYEDEKGEEHTVATLEDGLKFAGDTKDVAIAKKLNETLDVKGGISDTTLLTDNNIGVVAKSDGGLTVKLAKKLNLADGSITIASEAMKDENGNWLVKGEDGNWYTDLTDAVYDADTQTYTKDGETLTAVANPMRGSVKLSSTGLDNGNQRIVNVATGIDGTDAVNVAQLKKEISDVTASVGGAHTELTLDGKYAEAGANDALGDYIGDNNLTMAVKNVNGQKVYDLKLKNEVVIGQPGKDGKDGTPGSIGLVGPQGPAGEDGQPGKNAYGEISVKNGADGVDGKHGKDGITRIVYEDEKGEEHTVATLEDGLKFAGDTENVTIAKKLNETLDVKGGISDTTLLTDNNIGVVAKSDGGLTVKLAKNLDLADGSVRIGGTTGEDGVVSGGIYIAKQQGVATTKDGVTDDGSFITGLTNTKWDPDNKGIVSGRAATEDQLEKAISKVSSDVGGAHTELTLDGKSATAGDDGELGKYIGDNNLTMAVKDVNGQKVYDLKLKNEIVIGQPGKDGKDGTPGSIGLVGPKGKDGEDGQPGKNAYGEISVKNGADGVDGKHGKDGITRIVYVDENDEEHTVATLEDGLKFAGDTKDVTIAKKLNETLEVKGGISDTSLLTDNNIGVVAQADGGLTVKLAKNLNLADGSVRIGGTTGEDGAVTGGIYIAKQQGVATTKDGGTGEGSFITGLTNTKWDPDANGIVSGRAATEDQLEKAISTVSEAVGGAHTELTLDGKSAKAGADGALGDYIGDNNLTMAVKDVNGQKVYDLKLKNEVVIGQPGKDGKDGTPGSIGLVGPAGPAGEDGQPGKNAYGEISVKNGADGVDGKHGKDGITRIVYVDENDEEHTVATLEDGLKFAGDTENVTIAKKLNETLEIKGGISNASLLTDDNIGVVAKSDGGLTVKLAKNINLADGGITIASEAMKDENGKWLFKGKDGNWYTDLRGAVYDADTQTYTKDGVALTAVTNLVRGSVTLSATGLDNGNQRIVNVAPGKADTDAVNMAQLRDIANKPDHHNRVTVYGETAEPGENGEHGEYVPNHNLTMGVREVDGQLIHDIQLSKFVDLEEGQLTFTTPQDENNPTFRQAADANTSQVTLSAAGLDSGNQRIVNVADGVDDKDAVNVSQLKANKVTLTAGTNVKITDKTEDDGSTNYTIASTDTITGLTNTTWDPTTGIVSGRAATEDQLNAAISKVTESVGGAHTELTLDGKSATAGANGALGDYIGDNNLTMAVKNVNGQKVYDLKLKNEVVIGQPGKDGKDGTPGSIGLVGPQGPAGEDGQPGKNAYGEISVKNGADGVDGTNGKDGMTRIVYVDENDKEHTVATLEDGLKFAGDTKDVTIAKKLNETLEVKGGISDTSLLTDNNIGVVAQANGGLTVKLAKDLDLNDGSITIASDSMKDENGKWLVKGEDGNWYTDLTGAVYDADTQTYTKDGETLTAVANPTRGSVKLSSTGLDNGNQRIVNVAAGIDGTDAVNVAQLKKEISDVTTSVGGAHTELTLDGKSATAGANGALGDYIGDNNLTMAVKDVNGQKVYDLKLKNEVVIGTPGKDGKDGTPGSIGLVGPAGPAGEDGQPGKNAYGEISVKNGADGVDGTNGKDGMTRIVYVDENDKEHTVATLEDGLKFAGDTENVTIAKKLNETLSIKGGISDEDDLVDNNIGVVAKADGGLTVKLAKNINLADGSVRIGGTTGADGVVTGGIYIANQKGVATNKAGMTEDGAFVTGLSNTKWDPAKQGIVSGRAATEDQLEAVYNTVSKHIESANVTGGKNITVDTDNKVSLKDNITLGDENGKNVAISGESGTISAGNGDNKVVVDGTQSTVTAGTGEGKVTVDGNSGLVTVGDITTGAISIGKQTVTPKVVADGVETNGTAKEGKFITGLENTTWNPDEDGYVADRAATEGQLKDLSQKIKEVGEIKDGVRTYASDDSGDKPLTRKNSEAMELRGGAASDNLSDDNIGVVTNSKKTGFDIKLSKDIKGVNTIQVNNSVKIGNGDNQTVIEGNTVNTGSVTTGNTTINNDGLKIVNEDSSKNITIQSNNVNMGGNAIHNVGEATEANDAVNKGQFDRTISTIGAGMNEMSGRIGKLDRRVDRVGAGAAALAALHPLEYSPDAKWEVTAGLGKYGSANAVAVGAFYRPNYDTLFSIGASYGGGENLVNAGVTWRIGEGETKAYPSKQVMAQEIDTLKSELAQQNDKIEAQSEQLEAQNRKIEELLQAVAALTK